ncbi:MULTISPECIES: hypothetical protein [unclassified Bartonella]|uniref:hypothetical protein n=1 Tax=unclassified Bartonella TaxID=2645622 RepID=UPI0035CF85A5
MLQSPFRDGARNDITLKRPYGNNVKSIERHYLYAYEEVSWSQYYDSSWHLRAFRRNIFLFIIIFTYTSITLVMNRQAALIDPT